MENLNQESLEENLSSLKNQVAILREQFPGRHIRWPLELKVEILNYLEKGYSVSQLGEKLGIKKQNLYDWNLRLTKKKSGYSKPFKKRKNSKVGFKELKVSDPLPSIKLKFPSGAELCGLNLRDIESIIWRDLI